MFKKVTLTALSLAAVASLAVTGATPALAIEPNPQVMTISGTPALGQEMTITFDPNYTIVGNYFDIWMCQDKNVIPNDNEAENGTCVPLTFWDRALVPGYDGNEQTTARSMKWTLQDSPALAINPDTGQGYIDASQEDAYIYPPSDEDDNPESWCAYAGWFFNVNDYSGGGNSNWSEAFSTEGCETPTPTPGALPDTGSEAGVTALASASLLLAGAIVFLVRRRLAK